MLGVFWKWFIPIAAGAVIGYVTNALAIKMLFRPLKPIYLFGKFRLPFTPGIIPRQRYSLAESIGVMVSKELLTKDAVSGQLANPAFHEAMEKKITLAIGDFFDADLGDFLSKAALSSAKSSFDFGALLTKLIRSGAFERIFILTAGKAVGKIKTAEISSWLKNPEQLAQSVAGFITTLSSPAERVKTRAIFDNLKKAVKPGSSSVLKQILAGVIDSVYPYFFSAVINFLERPESREELQEQGKKLVNTVLEQMNSMQRFLVSAARYDKTVKDGMPKIVEDLIRKIEESGQKEEIQRSMIQAILDHQSNDFTAHNSGSRDLAERVFDMLHQPSVSEAVKTIVLTFLNSVGGKSLGELIFEPAGLDDQVVAERLYSALLMVFENGNMTLPEGTWPDVLSSLIESLKGIRIRDFLGEDSDFERELSLFAIKSIIRILEENIPQLLDAFNIKSMVVNRVNSLDVLQVERLLLQVIENQLQWINVIGGVLGGMIGAVQVLLSRFL